MRPIPRYFQDEIRALSPRLRVAWVDYGVQTIVIPVAGTGYMRYVRKGARTHPFAHQGFPDLVQLARNPKDPDATIVFRYHNEPHPDHGSREFPAPPEGRSLGRVSILYTPRSGGREEVLVDLVEQEGLLIEPDTRALVLLAQNRDPWARLEQEEEEARAQQQKAAEAELEAAFREPANRLYDEVHGIERSMPKAPEPQGELHPAGFYVLDRRVEKRSHLAG